MTKHYKVIRFGCGINGKGWAIQRDNGDTALFLSHESAAKMARQMTEDPSLENMLNWDLAEKKGIDSQTDGR